MSPRFILVFILLISGSAAAAPPHESRVRAIDQEVLAIDKAQPGLGVTTAEHCNEEHTCVTRLSYWDNQGRLRKTVEKAVSDVNPSAYTGRYYSACQLILVRTAPAGREAVKHPEAIARYYFHKGKLLRVVIGDVIQRYTAEQMKDTQRTQFVKPEKCMDTGPA